MYVVTFYSFKGGVGRTMALVNVGIELAKRGQRVVLVDFDLEAPGIQTFRLPPPKTPGLVEYVSTYLQTRKAPDVSEFVSEWKIKDLAGKIWIMPAGLGDQEYGRRLASIDWQVLYKDHDGYLMFEDLKAQWKETLKATYVLVDSRTGHTDVGGICTRQLPDAVAILFFPNDQNLAGLERIVKEIRGEAIGPRKKQINLHFIASNLPNLDDEEGILHRRLEAFEKTLGCSDHVSSIHHYDSLHLLDQRVFVLDRPQSRLSQEYRDLVELIVRQNPEDAVGALAFLDELIANGPFHMMLGDAKEETRIEEHLELIETIHPMNGEVLFKLAQIRDRQSRFDEAIYLLNHSAKASHTSPTLLLTRADVYLRNGEPHKALEDVRSVLNSPDAKYSHLTVAVRKLQKLAPGEIPQVSAFPAVVALSASDKLALANKLLSSRSGLTAASEIFSYLVNDATCPAEIKAQASQELSLVYIGARRFGEAMKAIAPDSPSPASLNQRAAFNYAMAQWGATGCHQRDMFQRVVDLDKESNRRGPNYLQCLSISWWAIGDLDRAQKCCAQARQRIRALPISTEFSGWRYLVVPTRDFLRDLDEIAELISGKAILPRFMRIEPTMDAPT